MHLKTATGLNLNEYFPTVTWIDGVSAKLVDHISLDIRCRTVWLLLMDVYLQFLAFEIRDC